MKRARPARVQAVGAPRPRRARHHPLGRRSCLWWLAGLLLAVGACRTERSEGLVEVRSLAPGLRTDLRYATTNNFTGRRLYPSDRCYLRRPVARRLAAAQAELERQGLGLKVWDGYRPLSVQRQLWLLVPDERYVASPSKGSRHNRGAAVDVTLVRKDGSELPMPTGFDDFSPKAHRDCQDLPAEAIRHRELLERIMAKHGFLGLRTEWWHFDDAEWPRYDLLDLPAP